jgi:hypothetical protein
MSRAEFLNIVKCVADISWWQHFVMVLKALRCSCTLRRCRVVVNQNYKTILYAKELSLSFAASNWVMALWRQLFYFWQNCEPFYLEMIMLSFTPVNQMHFGFTLLIWTWLCCTCRNKLSKSSTTELFLEEPISTAWVHFVFCWSHKPTHEIIELMYTLRYARIWFDVRTACLAASDAATRGVFRAFSFTDNRKLSFPHPLWSPPLYFHLISGSNNQITFPFMAALCMCVLQGCFSHVTNQIRWQ